MPAGNSLTQVTNSCFELYVLVLYYGWLWCRVLSPNCPTVPNAPIFGPALYLFFRISLEWCCIACSFSLSAYCSLVIFSVGTRSYLDLRSNQANISDPIWSQIFLRKIFSDHWCVVTGYLSRVHRLHFGNLIVLNPILHESQKLHSIAPHGHIHN